MYVCLVLPKSDSSERFRWCFSLFWSLMFAYIDVLHPHSAYKSLSFLSLPLSRLDLMLHKCAVRGASEAERANSASPFQLGPCIAYLFWNNTVRCGSKIGINRCATGPRGIDSMICAAHFHRAASLCVTLSYQSLRWWFSCGKTSLEKYSRSPSFDYFHRGINNSNLLLWRSPL